jgi:hypothetical protein
VKAASITRSCRAALWLLLSVAVAGAAEPPQRAAVATASAAGEAIYRFGRLPNGEPLRGEHETGVEVEGTMAACVNCHRRSGLGELEGRSYIPPVTGQFLFHSGAQKIEDIDLPYIEGSRPHRAAYTQASLARAIREGIDADGRKLGYLMPRYALDDAAMVALTDYLRQLTATHVPGVSDTMLQFATIVTPDADPVKRQGMLAVLNDYFAEKNARTRAASPDLRRYQKAMFRAARQWQLHVWELTGPASTWEAQLRRFQSTEPVFAVISGLGGKDWAPIHHFCEQASLPCLFPNVELPVVAEQDFHSLYFSKGVLLESGLIAAQLHAAPGERPQRLVQVYRQGDVGAAAAAALDDETHDLGLTPLHRELGSGDHASAALEEAVKDLGPADALVLWLRPKDIAALGARAPKLQSIWVSGQMSGLENAPLPAPWRVDTRMAYPYDLPDARRVRVDYPLGWFTIRHIAIVDLQVQSDTYLACGLLSETLTHMADAFVPDYLIERIEGMLEHRVVTGYYPRLTLAQGQRFASKGGYIVRFKEPTGNKVVAASDWIVP